MEQIDWDDPEQRARLVERVGPVEYERLLRKHFTNSTVTVVNGHRIRPVMSRFGRLYQIGKTRYAMDTLEAAMKRAAELQPGSQD
jgi:hypothetical protein